MSDVDSDVDSTGSDVLRASKIAKLSAAADWMKLERMVSRWRDASYR
jgi:hypothetical protein